VTLLRLDRILLLVLVVLAIVSALSGGGFFDGDIIGP
jgi:hypothetical protein